jgi:hypothetical protein
MLLDVGVLVLLFPQGQQFPSLFSPFITHHPMPYLPFPCLITSSPIYHSSSHALLTFSMPDHFFSPSPPPNLITSHPMHYLIGGRPHAEVACSQPSIGECSCTIDSKNSLALSILFKYKIQGSFQFISYIILCYEHNSAKPKRLSLLEIQPKKQQQKQNSL